MSPHRTRRPVQTRPGSRPPDPRGAGERRQRAGRRGSTLVTLALVVAFGLLGAAAALLVAGVVGTDSEGRQPSARPGAVVLRSGGDVIGRLALAPVAAGGRLDAAALRSALARELPAGGQEVSGRATVRYRFDRAGAVGRVLELGVTGGVVRVAREPIASQIAAPVVRQAQRNTCEAAALEILLATTGVQADQLRIQARLPRSGAPDPRETSSGRVWGDPELGYVGRPDGGGTAGGFGVYEGPVRSVAREYRRRLDDLRRATPRRIYGRLLQGRAVMAWVGLSEGPYGEWTSPSGRAVRVNFGEHTVVLTGVRPDGRLRIVNPLTGTREIWSKQKFESMWTLLGRRALAA